MHDITLESMRSESRDLFNFWEIIIISHKRCKAGTWLQWKTNRKSYVANRIAPSSMPLNNLNGHFFLFET